MDMIGKILGGRYEIIEKIMNELGYREVEVFKDLNGIERGLTGIK